MPTKRIHNPQLSSLRNQKAAKEKQIFLQKERKKMILEQENRLQRYMKKGNSQHTQLQEELKRKRETCDANLSAYSKELFRINTSLNDVWEEFIPLADPKENLDTLDESYPVLLMPLRIETRFMKVKEDIQETKDQLWVRVYPDDCFVDTFEETLSESEIRDVQVFWTDWWAAAGDESKRRAAWKYLVDGHGHGRAQYIKDHYQPDNFSEILHSKPEGSEPTVFLVINGYPEITDVVKPALTKYWQAAWHAMGDQDKLKNAKASLDAELGSGRATYLVTQFPPGNFEDPPPAHADPADTIVEVKYIAFQDITEVNAQQKTWSRAPEVRIMPECLYLLGYRNDSLEVELKGNAIPFPLIVGPDPGVQKEDLLDIPGVDIQVTRDMRWMVDFEEAVAKGMGFKVDLTAKQVVEGFDRLFVLGVKMNTDREEGKSEIEELIKHHYYGNSGFSLLPVGTSTNNTLESASGFTESDDADESFDIVFKSAENGEEENENTPWWAKSDRSWFSEMLGISEEIFRDTINTDGYDQREARAVNIALWPATWGYFFETMLDPVLSDSQIQEVRWYFNHFVVGRGTIPSIRIDDQPYGILPTTVFSRIEWLNEKQLPVPDDLANEIPAGFKRFLPVLNQKFGIIQEDWRKMVKDVSYVGKEGDPHQLLLDILGLHGGSVEFYNRIGESFNHIYNLYKMGQTEKSTSGKLVTKGQMKASASNQEVSIEDVFKALANSLGGHILLRDLGYKGHEKPEILEKLFVLNAEKLKGPVIDDKPLSEVNPVREYSKGPDGNASENYIEWLIRVAGSSFEKLRKEEDFIDNKSPDALLYLMLKYALEQSYFEAGLNLYLVNEVLDSATLRIARREPDFIHIRDLDRETSRKDSTEASGKPLDYPFESESRYNLLYRKESAITNSPGIRVVDFIPEAIGQNQWATRYLSEQLEALRLLEDSPTARLERAFIEHLDCASYRFDAWKHGILNYQLKSLRNRPESDAGGSENSTAAPGKGIYIGAYGWLENVKSENKELREIDLEPELKDVFNPEDNSPVYLDDKNLGFINAPSLNHAVTAAILRNGYLSRADQETGKLFNINLSSERVRKALKIIEGMQNGQSLAALLGYQFERGIHDNNPNANVDHFIFKIRRKFPLVSNHMRSTMEEDEDVSIAALEARNVLDGLELIRFVEENLGSNGEPDYINDFGIEFDNNTERKIVIQEIDNIRDANDAVADLGFAESIHQVVQGNIDRAAGTLDTYSSGNYPQIPDVIQTPRSGVNITHRVGVQIDPEAPATGTGFTPRAMAEPGLNSLLKDFLPSLSDIKCSVSFHHQASASDITDTISMADLGLQPIDMLFMVQNDTRQEMNALDDRILNYVMNKNYPDITGVPPRPDAKLNIRYYIPAGDTISIFEIAPLIDHLRSLLLESRPLDASDVSPGNETGEKANSLQYMDPLRVENALKEMNEVVFTDLNDQTMIAFLDSLVAEIKQSVEDEMDDDATIITRVDGWLDRFIRGANRLSLFGLQQTGSGFGHSWRKAQMDGLFKKIKELIDIWEEKGTEYSNLMLDYESLPTDEEKIEQLLRAEKLISTAPTEDPGTDPDVFKIIVTNKKASFDNRGTRFESFLNANYTGIWDALYATESGTEPLLDYSAFYLVPTDTEDLKKAIRSFANELLLKAKQLKSGLNTRITKVDELLNDHASSTSAKEQVSILQEAGKLLLTEEFKMIPGFNLPAEVASEWQNALDASDQLLDFQINSKKNTLPVDEWFYGVARVRAKMGQLEQSILLSEGFTSQSLELTPVQFPFLEPYCWFAMEFGHEDEDKKKELNTVFRENDHVLYTAYYHKPFDASSKQCGILIDDWTEIIPTEEETAGVAFHYDRPDSEPPQTILLALSPQMHGRGWLWQDLVDILHETLDEAKLRAVEPEQIDRTRYANLLPANISTVTKYPISIMLNYAFNNQSVANFQPDSDE